MCCRPTKAIVVAALLSAGPAIWPAPASAATADEIRTGLRDWLAETLPQSRAGLTAALDGEIAVTASGTGFRADLPPVRLSLGAAGSSLLIDAVTVELQPLVSGGYAANWRLPDRIDLQAADGAVATISIGGQSGHGLYAPDLALMLSTDLELRDIRIAVPGRPAHLALDSLTTALRYDAVAGGVFDQTTELRIGGLVGLKPDGSQAVRIASIALSGGARGIDLAAWRDLRTALQSSLGHRPKSSTPQTETVGQQAILDSYRGTHRIRDASFDIDGDPLRIGDGALDFVIDGLDSGASSLTVAFSLSGIDLPAAMGPMMPREMAVDLEISGLPTERLFEALTAVAGGAGLSPSNNPMALFGLYLQDTMMTSGAQIAINEVLVVGDDTRLRLAGVVNPTYAAPLGLTAELELSISGLGDMVAAAQENPGDPQTLQQLTLLQMVGTPGADPDGTAVLRYVLDITQQGQLLLNGADLLPALAVATP